MFQLTSNFAILLTVGLWIYLPMMIWRHVIGSLSSSGIWVYVHVGVLTYFNAMLNAIELFSVKLISVVVLKRPLPVLDDLMVRFMTMANLLIALMLTMTHCSSDKYYKIMAKLLSEPEFTAHFSPLNSM